MGHRRHRGLVGRGRSAIFAIIDHASGEVFCDASLHMDRWAAADLLREVTTERFGSVERAIAAGLALRYDGGPCFRSEHYQAEIDHLGIARSPLPVSCWCEAIPCRVCGKQPAQRPISNYYDEASGEVWHVSHFGGVCDECKATRRKSSRPMT